MSLLLGFLICCCVNKFAVVFRPLLLCYVVVFTNLMFSDLLLCVCVCVFFFHFAGVFTDLQLCFGLCCCLFFRFAAVFTNSLSCLQLGVVMCFLICGCGYQFAVVFLVFLVCL